MTEEQKVEATVKANETRFHALIENSADSIVLIDAEGKISYVAPSVKTNPNALIGRDGLQNVHPDDRARVQYFLAEIQKTPGARQAIEARYRDQNGVWQWIEATAHNLLAEPAVQAIVVNYRNITSRKHIELEIQRQAKTMTALFAITHDLISVRDLPRLLYTIVERATQLLNATGGGLYLCEPEKKEVRCVVSYNTKRDYTGTVLQYGEGLAGRVAQTGEPLIIDNYRIWEGRANIYEGENPFDRVLSVPIKWQVELIGVLHVLKVAREPQFTQDDLQLLTAFANQAALAVQNARLYALNQQELTERKLAEEALRHSEERFSKAFRTNPAAIVITKLRDGKVVDMNLSYERLLGYSREQMIGHTASDLNILYDPHERQEIVAQLEQHGSVHAYETTLRHKSGEIRHVLASVERIELQGESCILAIFYDVTERKQAEADRQQSESRKKAILESALDAIITIDGEGTILEFNSAAENMFGYEREQAQGHKLADLIIPAYLRKQHHQGLQHYHATGEGPILSRRLELPALRSDGTEFPVELSITRIGNDASAYFTGFIRDITVRKQRERELEAIATMANALRATQNRAEVLPIILDQLLDLLHAESAALDMLDPERREIVTELGRGGWANVTGMRHPVGIGLTSYVMATGQPYVNTEIKRDVPGEHQVARPDLLGDVSTIACIPLIVPGQVIGAAWVGRNKPFDNDELRLLMAISDITANAIHRATVLETLEQQVAERTRELAGANERLKELDKLKDEFVSNVSHELRTPITNIKMYLNLLKQTGKERLERYLPILLRENDRLATLIEDLLTMVQIEQGRISFVAEPRVLDALLAEVFEIHTGRIQAKKLTVIHEPNPYAAAVWVDYAGIMQVFNNLIGNAVAYTPPEGHIVCRVTQHVEQVTVTIHNSGPGIPPEDVPYLFDRFYRGKNGRSSAEPGTGLGLAISRKIIEQHGGRIEVESREAEGTTFSLWLPIKLS